MHVWGRERSWEEGGKGTGARAWASRKEAKNVCVSEDPGQGKAALLPCHPGPWISQVKGTRP